MKCMRNEGNKRFRPHINKLELEIEGMKDFSEERRFGSREKREISKCLSESEIWLTLEYI